jgi:high-affinity nickel permease
MRFPRTAVSEWAWEGGPFRRFLLSLAATAVVVLVAYFLGSPTRLSLIMLFVGFDLGAWFMDSVYVDRLTRRTTVVG